MKLETAPQDIAVNGNFATSDFAVGDLAFIVDMFADKVYTHKERAVIRELACNAHDSHVMAGTTDIPFDVHLPTSLEPFFSIRDYGTGLDDHEVRNIFAGIGISTKRDSNDVIGCFGIGSLSPYSMTDSFTVKSYKDGICRSYSCYRDETRKPVVALLVEGFTDEPNGLEVSLSVNNKINEFESEAKEVFRFWEGTLPEINNKYVSDHCKNIRNSYIFSGDDFGLTGGYGNMYAVMGNITYRIPYELDSFGCEGYLKFNLGELEFDTARENLSMTDKVRDAIKSKVAQVKASLSQIAIDRINTEPTPFKRAVLANRLNKGNIGRLVKLDMSKYYLPETTDNIEVWKTNYRSVEKVATKNLPIGEKVEYFEFQPRMKQRVRSYAKETNKTIVLLTAEQIRQCLIDREAISDIDNIPKIERAAYSKGSSASNNIKTFEFSYNSNWRAKAKENWNPVKVDVNQSELVYVEIDRYYPINGISIISGSHSNINSTLETLKEHNIPVPIVYGLKSSFISSKGFGVGNWISLDNYVKREVKKIAIKGVYKYCKMDFEKMEALTENICSSELTEWTEYTKLVTKDSELVDIAKRIGLEIKTDNALQQWMDSFFVKYPILTILEHWEIRKNPEKIAPYIGGVVR